MRFRIPVSLHRVYDSETKEKRVSNLAASVRALRIHGVFPRHRRPHGLVVDFCVALGVQDGGRGTEQHQSFDCGRVRFDGFQKSGGPLDCWIQDVLDRILYVVVIRRGRVHDIIERLFGMKRLVEACCL